MGQSLKGKSSPFKDRYRFESCKTQDHEVISPLKRKPYSFSQKESHTPFLKGCPMTSSPDNNNIPLKNFLAKPWKGQRGNCCYNAETEIANTNQLSNQNPLFLPMVPRRQPLCGTHNCISRITMPARSANRVIRFME